MNRLQKIALFNLSVATVGLLLQPLHFLSSNLAIRIFTSVITVIICTFILASYVFRLLIATKGSIHYDERDKSIHKISALVGFATFFFVLFLTSMIHLFSVGFGSSVPIGQLFVIFMPGALSLFFAESLTTLIQYGWRNKGKKS